jgi:hypothetical protein
MPLRASGASSSPCETYPWSLPQIRQAVAVARGKRPDAVAFLAGLVEELTASGFIEALLPGGHEPAPQTPASTGYRP